MAKVYRVLKLQRKFGDADGFYTISQTEWGSELGKARSDLGDMLQTLEENCVVSIEAVEAPSTREEFVDWLNRHEISPRREPGNRSGILDKEPFFEDLSGDIGEHVL